MQTFIAVSMNAAEGGEHMPETMFLTDEDILAALQNSDKRNAEDAFRVLYENYDCGVRRTIRACSKFDSTEDIVDEISQLTWLTVFQKIKSYENRGNPISHWVNSIARHKTLEYGRKYHKLAGSEQALPAQILSHVGNPEEEIALNEIRTLLRDEIGRLTPSQKRVMELHLIGEDNRTIAQQLKIKLDNVYQLASQSRRALRASMNVMGTSIIAVSAAFTEKYTSSFTSDASEQIASVGREAVGIALAIGITSGAIIAAQPDNLAVVGFEEMLNTVPNVSNTASLIPDHLYEQVYDSNNAAEPSWFSDVDNNNRERSEISVISMAFGSSGSMSVQLSENTEMNIEGLLIIPDVELKGKGYNDGFVTALPPASPAPPPTVTQPALSVAVLEPTAPPPSVTMEPTSVTETPITTPESTTTAMPPAEMPPAPSTPESIQPILTATAEPSVEPPIATPTDLPPTVALILPTLEPLQPSPTPKLILVVPTIELKPVNTQVPTPTSVPEILAVSCPVTPAENRVVVVFNQNLTPDNKGVFIRSDKGAGEAMLSRGSALKAGIYRIDLVSFDDHTHIDVQPNESWFINITNGQNSVISQSIADLPDNLNTISQTVDGALVVPFDATEIQAVHAAYPDTSSPNSIVPVCAVLELVE